MCFSCVCLFILHAQISVLLLFLLVSGLAAACDCDTTWTFLLNVFRISVSDGTFSFKCSFEAFRIVFLQDIKFKLILIFILLDRTFISLRRKSAFA